MPRLGLCRPNLQSPVIRLHLQEISRYVVASTIWMRFRALAHIEGLRLEWRRTSTLVVPSPKGDLVFVAFLSRHSRAGLWILPSLPGLVCGRVCGRTGLELCWKRYRNGPPCRSDGRVIEVYVPPPPGSREKDGHPSLIRFAGPPLVPHLPRAKRAAPTRATLPVLTPTWPRPA